MTRFAKIRGAASYAARHGPEPAREEAARLLAQAATCQDAPGGEADQPPVSTAEMLHRLVLAAGDLAGRTWLEANGDDPVVAAFTALRASVSPPDPPRIDEIVSRVLWARFAPATDARDGAGQPSGRQNPEASETWTQDRVQAILHHTAGVLAAGAEPVQVTLPGPRLAARPARSGHGHRDAHRPEEMRDTVHGCGSRWHRAPRRLPPRLDARATRACNLA